MTVPPIHLAVPVDDLDAARHFYGQVLGLSEGRSSDHWIDWDFSGHQFVTHLVPGAKAEAGTSEVDHHDVPIPHFGLLLDLEAFTHLRERLERAGTSFLVEPYLRFPGASAEQWTMFFQDPAGNSFEFKSFRDEANVFAK